jgi:hypothetical protein
MTAPASPPVFNQDADIFHAGGAQHISIRTLLAALELPLISRA